MRSDQDGWEEIGKRCSANRRSLWMRLTYCKDVRKLTVEGDDYVVAGSSSVEKIELCAGRGGDDAYLVITKNNPQFAEVLEILLIARFAAAT